MASFCQNGFRKSLLFYLKTNANPKLLFKLMQSSQYFCFKEFPFSVTQEVQYLWNKLSYFPLNSDISEKFDIDDVSKHFWATQILFIESKETNIASKLISKMVFCNVTRLYLQNQQITLDELKFLVNDNLNFVNLKEVIVKDLNGQPLLIENVLLHFINVRVFLYNFRYVFSAQFGSDSTKNMMEILKKSKLESIDLFNVPEMFDIDTFFKFIKENPQIRFRLEFRNGLSDAYKHMLQAFTDQINDLGIGFFTEFRFSGKILKPSKLSRFGFQRRF